MYTVDNSVSVLNNARRTHLEADMNALRRSRIRKKWIDLLKVLDMPVSTFVEKYVAKRRLSSSQEDYLERLLEEAGSRTMHEILKAMTLQKRIGSLDADEISSFFAILRDYEDGLGSVTVFGKFYCAIADAQEANVIARVKTRKRRR